eukprot:gene2314-2853_t
MENKIIVICHGSHSLRVGLASDISPKTIPNLIARRRKTPLSDDQLLQLQSSASQSVDYQTIFNKNNNNIKAEDFDELKKFTKNLQQQQQQPSSSSTTKSQQQTSTTNKIYNQDNSHSIEIEPPVKKKKKKSNPLPTTTTNTPYIPQPLNYNEINYCIGEDAINVSRDIRNWECSSPIAFGTFNTLSTKTSMKSICDDLVEMWKYAIQRYLNIPSTDLSTYGCVYLIPDIFDKRELKEITSLLLKELPFTSALLYPESICTTFGASLMISGCVVDIGHDKITICCVDEGYLIPSTRITLRYGGRLLSKLLEILLMKKDQQPVSPSTPSSASNVIETRKISIVNSNNVHKYYFPDNIIPDLNTTVPFYQQIFESIKTNNINFNFESTINNKQKPYSFKIKDQINPSQINVYHFNADDVYQIVSMSLFYPKVLLHLQELLASTSSSTTPIPRPMVDHSDPFDDDFYRDSSMNPSSSSSMMNTNTLPGSISSTGSSANTSGVNQSSLFTIKSKSDGHRYSTLPLDEAIKKSIMLCGERIEIKRKFLSNLLIVGGGSGIPGLNSIIKSRVNVLFANVSSTGKSSSSSSTTTSTSTATPIILEVGFPNNIRQDVDPKNMSWKGGAIIGCLESSKEIWITRNEWKDGLNTSILKDRIPL